MKILEIDGTKHPGGGEQVGVTASFFTGILVLGAHGASRRGVQGEVRET